MSRGLGLAALLLLLAGGPVFADIYKCTRDDGTLVFTSDPIQLPADCRPEVIEGLPPLGILPEPAGPPPATPGSELRATDAGTGGKTFDDFSAQATRLVERFEDARRQAFNATLAGDKLAARRELATIRTEKAALLSDLDRSALSGAEKQQVGNVLSAISE